MPLSGFASICEEHQKTIVSRDLGQPTKHIANNVKQCHVTHYRIDGIVITDRAACDFLLINEDTYTAYLIELKGRDLVRSVEQLESTEATLKDKLRAYSLEFRIVASKARTHAIESVTFKRFKEKKKQSLIYKTNQIEEKI